MPSSSFTESASSRYYDIGRKPVAFHFVPAIDGKFGFHFKARSFQVLVENIGKMTL